MGKKYNKNRKHHQKNKNPVRCLLARTGRSGRSDLVSRIPELYCLKNKKITVIGLGCLGAPITLELARCGVGEIRVIDFDIVEPGTIVRWPIGLNAVGRYKTDVISDFIEKNYPYTKVIPYKHRIGAVRLNIVDQPELEILDSALADSDLVFDASAELGIQYLMSDIAAEKKIPFICISATNGNWGGRLVRIRPQKTDGCYLCYRMHEKDSTIPEPNADPKGLVQPVGCASPTFLGSGFDSGIIVCSGVRLAVSTLCENEKNGYPSFEWDVSIINLRNEYGNVTLPSIHTFILNKHPSCKCSQA